MTIRLPFARIAEWQRPVVRVHLISPWRAHLGDHAGHCIHRHRQQATDYLFAELPVPIDTSMQTWAAWTPVPAGSLCRLNAQLRRAAAALTSATRGSGMTEPAPASALVA
ncbi:hypothetical protein [Streptomyces lutosisoli]|uniref:Uncharacterized protein n=1 Tax=Streptomyces lutosisoli TaxID=2665721 RepID=A0ABW2W1D9_9ACTN